VPLLPSAVFGQVFPSTCPSDGKEEPLPSAREGGFGLCFFSLGPSQKSIHKPQDRYVLYEQDYLS